MNIVAEMINAAPTATIEDWSALPCGNGRVIIYGRVYNDTKNRFADGAMIQTSLVINQECKEGVIIKTENSTYLLGKEYIEPSCC